MNYQPGDVALSRSVSFIGWLIRLFTRSRYNHARLVVDTKGGTVEAMTKGAVRGRVRRGDLIIRPPMTAEQRAEIPVVAELVLLGKPYGFLGVVALGLAQFGVKPAWVRRKIQDRDDLFCSQLVDYGWLLTGFHAFKDKRIPLDVSPGDLGERAFRSGWKVVGVVR